MTEIVDPAALQAAISRKSGANAPRNKEATGKFAPFSANC